MERYKIYKDPSSATCLYDYTLSNGLNVEMFFYTEATPARVVFHSDSTKVAIYDADKNNVTAPVLKRFFALTKETNGDLHPLPSDYDIRHFIEFCKSLDARSLARERSA